VVCNGRDPFVVQIRPGVLGSLCYAWVLWSDLRFHKFPFLRQRSLRHVSKQVRFA
jgi:hypothetical protein